MDAWSSFFFWKCPQQYQAWAQEGQLHYTIDNFPQFLRRRDPAKTERGCTKIKNMVEKFRKRFYIKPGTVLSLNHMFYVRKGLNDIWMVYNRTSCGLNLSLWEPPFGLSIFRHTLCALLPGYSQCDMEVGEVFLNLPLHPELRPFARVDIAHIKSRPDEEGWYQDRTIFWKRWAKNFMGLIDSPYQYL